MAETTIGLEQGIGFPDDLHQWVSANKLVEVTFEALHHVLEVEASDASEPLLATGMPRILLTVLTYSYATGLYGSDDIEAAIPVDNELLYLSARNSLSGSVLRRFRRSHRDLLHRTLAKVMELAWRWRVCPLRERLSDHPQVFVNRPADQLRAIFLSAAESRINEAVLADTAALDN